MSRLPRVQRLAVEIAANEDAEVRAKGGELSLLRHGMLRAHEIAGIVEGELA